MNVYLKTKWFGTFLFTPDEVIEYKLFPQDPREIAQRLQDMQEQKILDEEQEITRGKKPIVDEDRLKPLGTYHPQIPSPPVNPGDHGYITPLLQEASILVAEKKVTRELEKPEKQLTQVVGAMDELVHVTNLLMERLREWYGSFDPEGLDMEGRKLAGLIDSLSDADTQKLGIASPPAMKSVAGILADAYRSRDIIERHIQEWMPQVAPNLCQLVGATVGARLIALAGGLERLAMMPAGTIQLLGAENALFRHLKEGTAPPKHGVLFQHELVNKAPFWQRGKIARSFAAKIATGAKADAFTQRDISAVLQRELDARIKDIRKRYPHEKKMKKIRS